MLVDYELENLNTKIINALEDNENYISNDIIDYLISKSKKIRSSFVFLFSKALGIEINEDIYNLACAVELVHNATLVHDDIIDNSDMRRGKVSLNYKLGNNLSVLSGDILLSAALQQLVKCNNINVIQSFADCIYTMCKGEINQNSTIGKLPAIDEYIKKSRYKTAELFKAALIALAHIKDISQKENISSFAYNFGIAFQIRDDLLNILESDKSKPALSDINNGIYTAPVIYLNEDKNVENLEKAKIALLVQNKKYIQKTIDLIKEYALKAIEAINFIGNNEYKNEITKITHNLYKAGYNG